MSELFLQLHISEKTGRGVPKIMEVYGKEAFDFRQNSIVVTIPFNRIDLEKQTKGIPPVIPSVIPPVDSPINSMSQEEKILSFCEVARGIREIMEMLQYKDKKTVRKYLDPLIEQGRVAMTLPDKPNSSKQKYITIR